MTTPPPDLPEAAPPEKRPPFLAEFLGWVIVGVVLSGPALWGVHAIVGNSLRFGEALFQGLIFGVLMGLFGRSLARLIDCLIHRKGGRSVP